MRVDDLVAKIARRISRDIKAAIDENFETSSYFGKPWTPLKYPRDGKILILHGDLRRSIEVKPQGPRVTIRSSVPYAVIHNNGGTINQVVTPKQRGLFRHRSKENVDEDGRPTDIGVMYKYMAMARKIKITIPPRPFIGNHPELIGIIEQDVKEILKDYTGFKDLLK